MITFFSAPKPFRGHIGIIQWNAIQSWKRVHPDAEVILFGDEEGIADAARELGTRHVPNVKRNEYGTPFLAPIFDGAHDMARNRFLCYVNCDIILLSDFRAAAERVAAGCSRFLMAGQRWDTDIIAPVNFGAANWETVTRQIAVEANGQRPPQWIDYFLFSNGLYYKDIPPLVIGRPGFDNWLVWCARSSGAFVVDATRAVMAVHQNHDYSHHPGGADGVSHGDEARQNYALLQGGRRFATMENATHRLTPDGLQRNYRHWLVQARRKLESARNAMWFGILNVTRPLRHRLGLRQSYVPKVQAGRK